MNVKITDGSKTLTTSSKSHIGGVEEARVTFTSVTAAESEDEESTISTEEFSVDLMKLNEGIDTTITDISIPAGTYEQVRLKAGDDPAQLTFDDGSTNTAQIASDQIKLNFSPAITVESADDRVEVTVDWTVESSLEGQQGNFVITPVVQAEATVTSATDDADDSDSDNDSSN